MLRNYVMSSRRMYATLTERLNASHVNPQVLRAQYAVRGEIAIKADEYKKKLDNGEKLPFSSIIYCNIGNPQQLLQKPITYTRQVLSVIEYPELLEKGKSIFPPDVLERAENYLNSIGARGTGPYSHSQGVRIVREEVAKFIEKRDGYPSDPESIFLTNGASQGVHWLLKTLILGPSDGIMIPIPQYPLYSVAIALYNGSPISYFLDEDNNWSLKIDALEAAISKTPSLTPKVLVVINPGNPTGQCLTYESIEQVIRFADKYNIVLMADEVYQENIYDDKSAFHSFKKVKCDLGSKVQLVSFHSISKGLSGECGKRGGYFELVDFHPDVKRELYKIASVDLCSNVTGQIATGLMVQPPQPNEPSYAQFQQEYNDILSSLKRRADKLVKGLNKLEGIVCNPAQGAMYAFPRITLPQKAIDAAKAAGKQPDMFYCLELLSNTGICVVPGSGFGQRDGTFHFRTTFLPLEKDIDKVIARYTSFHKSFLERYA